MSSSEEEVITRNVKRHRVYDDEESDEHINASEQVNVETDTKRTTKAGSSLQVERAEQLTVAGKLSSDHASASRKEDTLPATSSGQVQRLLKKGQKPGTLINGAKASPDKSIQAKSAPNHGAISNENEQADIADWIMPLTMSEIFGQTIPAVEQPVAESLIEQAVESAQGDEMVESVKPQTELIQSAKPEENQGKTEDIAPKEVSPVKSVVKADLAEPVQTSELQQPSLDIQMKEQAESSPVKHSPQKVVSVKQSQDVVIVDDTGKELSPKKQASPTKSVRQKADESSESGSGSSSSDGSDSESSSFGSDSDNEKQKKLKAKLAQLKKALLQKNQTKNGERSEQTVKSKKAAIVREAERIQTQKKREQKQRLKEEDRKIKNQERQEALLKSRKQKSENKERAHREKSKALSSQKTKAADNGYAKIAAVEFGQKIEDSELDFSCKQHCVDEFAKRWWYAIPAWPPVGYNYAAILKQIGFREVDQAKFNREPELDPATNYYKKVHQVDCFVGVYKDSDGHTYDLRPAEGKPSLRNFQTMPMQELHSKLLKAYQEQLQSIQDILAGKDGLRPYDRQSEELLVSQLTNKIKKLQALLSQIKAA